MHADGLRHQGERAPRRRRRDAQRLPLPVPGRRPGHPGRAPGDHRNDRARRGLSGRPGRQLLEERKRDLRAMAGRETLRAANEEGRARALVRGMEGGGGAGGRLNGASRLPRFKMTLLQRDSIGGKLMAATLEATLEAAGKPIEIVLDPERSYEIVNGQPEEKEMPGAKHGVIGASLIIKLGGHVESKKLGVICAEASFKIAANERIPDVSFVAADRIPEEGIPETIWPISPDLAIEIISPNDVHEKVSEKVLEYLEAGV